MKAGVVVWTGRVLSVLVSALFIMSAVMKFLNSKEVQEGWAKSGYPANTLIPIGITEVACVVFYLIPQTAVLGAVLLTGYLGGAIATHVHGGEPFIPHIVIGLLIWGALYLRDPRLRQLLPIRKLPAAESEPLTKT